jgi:hypothetical protein
MVAASMQYELARRGGGLGFGGRGSVLGTHGHQE